MGFLGLDFSSTKATFHSVVRMATIVFAICSIVFPGILMGRYIHAKTAITNTTTPCFDEGRTDNFDSCDNKGVPLADRFKGAVTSSFKNKGIFDRALKSGGGPDDFSVGAASLFTKQCQNSDVNPKEWKDTTGTEDICLKAWTLPETPKGKDGDCTWPTNKAGIDWDDHLAGGMNPTACDGGSGTAEDCGITCDASNVVEKMSVEYFLTYAELDGKKFDEILDAYVEDNLEPLPFDGNTHLSAYHSVTLLYRNMDKFSLAGNLSIGDLNNLEAANPHLRQVVHEVSDVSQTYYLFLQTHNAVIVIFSLGIGALVLIIVSEWNQMRKDPSPLIQSSFFHWLYTGCYFFGTMFTIVFFAISLSSDFHMPLFRGLDDLMVDTDSTNNIAGVNDYTDNGAAGEDYRSFLWESYDQPSLLHRLRVIALWWHLTFYAVILSLTAHLSVKLGPLAQIVKKEVDSFTEKKNQGAAARAVASKVPTAAKYLPLVSVVRG